MSLIVCRQLAILFLFLSFAVPCAHASDFSFDENSEGWTFYGDGDGEYRAGVGAKRNGSLYLSCNTGENSTVYGKFKLTPGRYMVTANVRMLDVQDKKYGPFWIFFQASPKIVYPDKDLHGSFGWKRISFTMDVEKENVTLWFRLRSPGRVWIDDFSVAPYQGSEMAFQEDDAGLPSVVSNPPGLGIRCPDCLRWYGAEQEYCPVCGLKNDEERQQAGDTGSTSRVLVNFEEERGGLEKGSLRLTGYTTENVTQGKRAGIFPHDRFINIDVGKIQAKDWSGYDHIALDVYNPTSENDKFSLAIGDAHGSGYWNELNHYSVLAPGWNHLKFHINRYVGERGSVKVKRYLDLRNIRKAWFFVTSQGNGESGDYIVDNIRLLKAPQMEPFTGAMLFDFVKSRTHVQSGFVGVESKTAYSKDVGFGFQDHTIWRTHDSVYADTLHRDGLFVLKGKFLVDLPNGSYVVRLVPNALGYWNEHFWAKRTIVVEGKTLLDESRDGINGYLKDQLRFEKVTPKPGDNPFDLYLSEIFKPYIAEVDVRDGQLTIEFSGSDSGILMNSLIVYPVAEKPHAPAFLASLEEVLRDEFSVLCRDITQRDVRGAEVLADGAAGKGAYVALIPSDVQLRYNQIVPSTGDRIELAGGRGQRPVQAMMVRNLRGDGPLLIESTALKSPSGKAIKPDSSWIRYAVQQYQSHTMNHEIYELAPRFLKSVGSEGIVADKDESILVWYQIPITETVEPGTYSGNLTVTLAGEKTVYPVSLKVYDFILPKPDVAVGFFGLQPISFGYFKSSEVGPAARNLRFKALQSLADRGFTTWTGLPSGKWKISKKSIGLDAEEVNLLMERARALGFDKKVFSYAGWRVIDLDKHGRAHGLSQEVFRKRTSDVLNETMKDGNWLPVVLDLSDEATGYSQKVDRDMKRARMVEKYYPFLGRGGYSQPIKPGEKGAELNFALTDISLSSQTDEYAATLKRKGIRWGLYNQAHKPFTNGRYAFGIAMYRAAKKGMQHQIGWSLTGSQNYPYYDLDGREFDAMMIFPRSDGGFDYALKFEWAAQGVEDYRLLLLLEQLVEKGGPGAAEAGEWLHGVQADPAPAPKKGAWWKPTLSLGGGEDDSQAVIPSRGDDEERYDRFRSQLYDHILTLSE